MHTPLQEVIASQQRQTAVMKATGNASARNPADVRAEPRKRTGVDRAEVCVSKMSEIGIPEDRLTPLPAGTTPDLRPASTSAFVAGCVRRRLAAGRACQVGAKATGHCTCWVGAWWNEATSSSPTRRSQDSLHKTAAACVSLSSAGNSCRAKLQMKHLQGTFPGICPLERMLHGHF